MTVPPKPLRPDEAYGLRALGLVIRRARRDVGVSQHTLAEVVGVDQSVISRLENGKLSGLRLPRLGAIVAALDGHVEFWIGHLAQPPTRRLPAEVDDDEGTRPD